MKPLQLSLLVPFLTLVVSGNAVLAQKDPDLTAAQVAKAIATMRSKDYATRSKGMDELIAIGKPAVPALIQRLRDKEMDMRWNAVHVLGYIRDPQSLPGVIERVLVDEDVHTRWRAIWAVGQVDDGTAADKLLPYLQSKNKTGRWRAAVALAVMGRKEAVPVLHEGLKSSDTWVQWEAANGLGTVHDENSVPLLIEALKSKSRDVVQEAALTLGRIGDARAVGALTAALQHSEREVRWRAALALGEIGDARALASLQDRLKTEREKFVRENVQEAIERIEKKAAAKQ
jgi:HEAT repeat protein